jgi:hypothetical protein
VPAQWLGGGSAARGGTGGAGAQGGLRTRWQRRQRWLCKLNPDQCLRSGWEGALQRAEALAEQARRAEETEAVAAAAAVVTEVAV